MRIVELEAQNVMGLKAISIKPGPRSSVILKGPNGAGKSSVITAIAMALGGKTLCPDEPIRAGQTRAHARVELDNGLVVERRFSTGKRDYLKVTPSDGSTIKRPQEVLDQLFSRITFDPLAFTAQEPVSQAETLRRLVGIDTAAIDAEIQRVYEERTIIGRLLHEAQDQLVGVPAVEAPDAEQSIAGLTDQLKAAIAVKARSQRLTQDIETARGRLTEKRQEIAHLEAKLEAARKEHDNIVSFGTKLKSDLEGTQIPDTAALERQIDEIDQVNIAVRAKKTRAALESRVEERQRSHVALDGKIETLRAQKTQALASARFPIEGLGIDGDRVTYRGIPLSQASKGEQLRITTAIGFALNPKSNIILVPQGAYLDEEGLAFLEAEATKRDGQVWIERPGRGGLPGVLIEEGEVVEDETASSNGDLAPELTLDESGGVSL